MAFPEKAAALLSRLNIEDIKGRNDQIGFSLK